MDEDPADLDAFYAPFDRRERSRRERRRNRRPPRAPQTARHLIDTRAGRILVGAAIAVAVLTVIGLVALWPGQVRHHGPSQAFGGPTRSVTVLRAFDSTCGTQSTQRCRKLIVSVDRRRVPLTVGPLATSAVVHTGDRVRISRTIVPAGAQPLPAGEAYQFVDLDRHGSLLWLVVGVAVLLVVLLRWKGLFAVVGVGLSLLLLTTFAIPAILDGRPALLVALVGSLAVMLVTVTLTNGVGAQTLAAGLGITATLLLTTGLAAACIGLAHLDGRASDVSPLLTLQNHSLSLRGVVLAGMAIGALGVLADTAVTQASAVMALRRADRSLSPAALYKGALSVGRDHLSATIHTLVLAYAGASLPLLLATRASGLPFGDAVNAQDIAEPIVATVVGVVGLIAAVPLTTGLASVLVSRVPSELLPHEHHHH